MFKSPKAGVELKVLSDLTEFDKSFRDMNVNMKIILLIFSYYIT